MTCNLAFFIPADTTLGRFRILVLLFCSQLGLALSAAESAVKERLITADRNAVAGRHSTAYRVAVGAGRAKEGLQPEWQRQLKLVHNELGFAYLRCHGIFHDDMGVYTEDPEGTPTYNWENVDAFHDYLLSVGVRPFVELSFMPSALALNK